MESISLAKVAHHRNPDIVLANDREERHQIGHSKKLPDSFAEVDDLQIATRSPGET